MLLNSVVAQAAFHAGSAHRDLPVLWGPVDVDAGAGALQCISAWARECRAICICNAHSAATATRDADCVHAVAQAEMPRSAQSLRVELSPSAFNFNGPRAWGDSIRSPSGSRELKRLRSRHDRDSRCSDAVGSVPHGMQPSTYLVLNYHRTAARPQSSDAHTIADAQLDAQLEQVAQAGLPVVPLAQALSGNATTPGHGVVITFDDGTASDLRNARKLAARGWSATFFVSTGTLGRPGYLTWDDLAEVKALGMSLGSHSHHHVSLTSMTRAEARHQLKHSRALLSQALGEEVKWLAFPGGRSNADVIALATDAGYTHLFGTAWGLWQPARHHPGQVIRRNNVVRGVDAAEFSQLILLRNQVQRRLTYGLIEGTKALLSEDGYQRLRSAVLSWNAGPGNKDG